MATVGSRRELMLEAESVSLAILLDWPRSYPQGCQFGCCTFNVAATDRTILSQYCKAVLGPTRQAHVGLMNPCTRHAHSSKHYDSRQAR
jgi:hypothetical protein